MFFQNGREFLAFDEVMRLLIDEDDGEDERQASSRPGTASAPRTTPVPLSMSRRVIDTAETFLLLT